jgi:diadenosine tetraphosphatase ApaH/serine/threonine PP2A family protein phosphatase
MKLALFSDLHSNQVALQACLEDLNGRDYDRFCMLGDMIAYGPRPRECVEAMRQMEARGGLCLKGNHDDNSVKQGTPLGVSEGIGRYELLDREGLGQENLAWVQALPAMVKEGDFCFVHASPREPMREYVDDEAKCQAALETSGARWVFCGHSHQPLWYHQGRLQRPSSSGDSVVFHLDPAGHHVVNVGSVGESRDGDPRACYAMVDTDGGFLEFRRVAYDILPHIEDMKAQGFPEALWRKRMPK